MYENVSFEVYNNTKDTPYGLDIKRFVIKHHYLKSISRGNKRVMVLRIGNEIKGIALFGVCVGTKAGVKYDPDGHVIELRRFCLSPDLKKNSASWFMGKCIRQLKQEKFYTTVISYADPSQGHEGIIYKASNFNYIGTQEYPGVMILYKKKKYHLRCAYQIGTKTSKMLTKAIKEKKAKRIYLPPKHIFLYNL